MQVFRLELPAPAPEFLTQVQQHIQAVQLDPDNKRWLDQFHNNTVNSALHLFAQADALTQSLRDQYQRYFHQHSIDCCIGIMKNTGNGLACLPPHVDRARALAINYYVELGGDRVSTVFYDLVCPISDSATNIPYGTVTPVDQYVFDTGWYAYGVNRCHSVENIESVRTVLIVFLNTDSADYDLDHFCADYPELISGTDCV